MHLQLFALLVICVAANYVQASEDVTTVSDSVAAVVETTISNIDSAPATAAAESKDSDDTSKEVDGHEKKFGHGHKKHHEHDATITIDVHNIMDLFKEQLKESEQRIIAAVGKDDSSSSAASSSSKESYRTADRNANKQDTKKEEEDDNDD
ncbi:unnamed protein product [Rotaria magnacalcarata]|uniref:Uncharacterized protein n=2 Tax=Rotaria magnacalcarata TaxID=392030 RepID=A0A816RGG4_9BILA|nr:unnamed protein product [Rotaria magnacalcarata]CAF1626134.1 unnamed protein product [Rotaria magnacalcarata]CAF2073062.1 unnamed protein product [Rotaria magnacalcarata]CAF3853890.1 unnamed protein product [Rotaria magnacalcarata]CAF3870431.1 unnamed protein product [Rotaria magnacalcarata]